MSIGVKYFKEEMVASKTTADQYRPVVRNLEVGKALNSGEEQTLRKSDLQKWLSLNIYS